MSAREWPIGSPWSVVEPAQPEREIYRVTIERLTTTQVVVRSVTGISRTRFRRDNGHQIGGGFYSRRYLVPAPALAAEGAKK